MNTDSTLTEQIKALKELNRDRFDYVMARADSVDVSTAIEKIGKSRGWYYQFPIEERERLERLAKELHYEKAIHAQLILQEASEEAAKVKVKGLSSRDQRVQQQVATEILDRTLGKPGEVNKLKLEGSVNLIWQPHKPTSVGES